MEICSSDLVLRCIGGSQDGKLIPIKTKKCLLGHGFDPQTDQKCTAKAAIFRGPNGTAVRTYCSKTTVNGLNSTVSWIHEGDQIKLPNLTIEIKQLGQWPTQNTTPSQPTASQSSSIVSSDQEPNMNTESTQADLELEAKIEAMRKKMSQIQNEVDAIESDEPTATDGLESAETSTEMKAASLIEETLAKIEASREEEQAPTPSPPKPAPPTESVAEVLARMQADGQIGGLDPELMQEELNRESALASASESTEPDVVQAETPQPEPLMEAIGEEEGGDVEDYMNQLFQRLRGPMDGTVAAAKATSSNKKETTAKNVEEKSKPESVIEKVNIHKPVGLLSAEEFKPKKVAPERDSNIDAMRELANQNARDAVAYSRSKRRSATRTAQLVIAAGGALGSVALFFFSAQIGDVFFCGGIGCALASLAAGGRYFVANRSNRKSDAGGNV